MKEIEVSDEFILLRPSLRKLEGLNIEFEFWQLCSHDRVVKLAKLPIHIQNGT